MGIWQTVAANHHQVIVTSHLIGGMSTLALLVWLWQRECGRVPTGTVEVRALRRWGALALAVVAVQIMLGGWVSASYAALACPDFPLCHGEWVPGMDFAHAFTFNRDLGMDANGNFLSLKALTAIHWSHRVWALAVLVFVGIAAVRRSRSQGALGGLLGALLLSQVGLGIANVWMRLPLALTVAHNAGAALLLATLVVIIFRLYRMR